MAPQATFRKPTLNNENTVVYTNSLRIQTEKSTYKKYLTRAVYQVGIEDIDVRVFAYVCVSHRYLETNDY